MFLSGRFQGRRVGYPGMSHDDLGERGDGGASREFVGDVGIRRRHTGKYAQRMWIPDRVTGVRRGISGLLIPAHATVAPGE